MHPPAAFISAVYQGYFVLDKSYYYQSGQDNLDRKVSDHDKKEAGVKRNPYETIGKNQHEIIPKITMKTVEKQKNLHVNTL